MEFLRRGRAALKFRPICVLMCLTFLFSSLITTSWYTRQPRIHNGRVEIVNHIHAQDGGLAAIREATTLEKIEPDIDTGTRSNQSKLGYLVILDIPEQLTSAVEDFVQLYMINQLHWKLGMIEPYVLGTRLAFSPPKSEDFRFLPLLSTYFNRSHMMLNLKKCSHSDMKLISFKNFLINAARSLIMLQFITNMTVAEDISECSFSRSETHGINILNHHLRRIKRKAIAVHGMNYRFEVVYSLCIKSKPQEPFSMLRVAKYVRQWMMKASGQSSRTYRPQHTVVIPQWRFIRNQPGIFFYYDPSFNALNFTDSCQLKSVPHTSYVKDTAGRVLDTLALPRPLIALHVRSEQIASQELKHHVKGFVEKCMALLPRVLQAVQRKYNVSCDHIIFIHDGTEYGSTSMEKFGRRSHSTDIISKVKALGIRNVQYKPLHNTRVDFAAPQFVEQEILLSADVLILVGSGSFQRSLLAKFTDKVKGGDKWYKMCSKTPQEDHLQELDMYTI